MRFEFPYFLATLAAAISTSFCRPASCATTWPSAERDAWSPVAIWGAAQLIPSPLLVVGSHGAEGGVRWQLTPLVYSFGVADRPWRTLIVSPVARHTGALELYLSPEWLCCAPRDGSGWVGRVGLRIYLPVIGHGESLSTSVGGSYYYENHRHGGAAEVGLYGLSSLLGVTATYAPRMTGRELVLALALHLY